MPNLPKLYLWGGAAALGALFLLTRQGVAEAIAKGAAGAVAGAAVGTIKGVGQVVGLPDTDADACTVALADGDGWQASLVCPAPRYLSWALGRSDFEAEKLKFIRSGA